MNRTTLPEASSAEVRCDALGRALVARLNDGSPELPHDISERLRVARSQAVALRKKEMQQSAQAVLRPGGAALMTSGEEDGGFWRRWAAALPLLALVGGLFAIHLVQNENRVNELAEIDAALLTDDLPPTAYTDPGFAQFVKWSRDHAQ